MIRELLRTVAMYVFLFMAVIVIGAGVLAVGAGIMRWFIGLMSVWQA